MTEALVAFRRFMSLEKLMLLLLFVAYLPVANLLDPDYYWHLETGEYMMRTMALPDADVFSYTKQGAPWTLHEWLFQLALYAVYSLTGETGVKIVMLLAVLLAINIAASAATGIARRPALTAVLMAAAFLTMVPFISPRPQLVTFVLFAIFLSALLKWKYQASDKLLWALPVLMIIWANSHGAYAIGIALLIMVTAIESALYWWRGTRDEAKARRLKRLAVVALLTLGASSINPYFVGLWLFPIEVSMMDATKLISEWKSPTFQSSMGLVYLCFVVGFFMVQVFRDRRPDLTEIGMPLIFVVLGFISMRHIPLATLAMLPFFVLAAGDGLTDWFARLIARLRPGRADAARQGKQLQGPAIDLIHWGLAAMIIVLGYIIYPARAGEIERRTRNLLPVEAVQFVIDADLRGRMFNNYGYGGYLIHRFYPDRLVFIDGRAGMYGDDFISDYINVHRGEPGWYEVFQEYRIDYVITKRTAPITQLLIAQGDFILVHEDENDVVLVRDVPKFSEVISEYGLKVDRRQRGGGNHGNANHRGSGL